MFFFLSLYMQSVLGYSPSHTGLAYLPLTAGFMISAGIATPLVPRIGTKPVIVGGALVAAGGLYFLSHVPVDGAFVGNLLPGIVLVALGAGAVFTGVTTAATEGVPADHARRRLRAPERLDAVRRRVRARRPLRGGHRAHRRRPRLGPRPSPGPHRRLPARLPDRRRARARRSARRLPGEQRPLSCEGERDPTRAGSRPQASCPPPATSRPNDDREEIDRERRARKRSAPSSSSASSQDRPARSRSRPYSPRSLATSTSRRRRPASCGRLRVSSRE